MYIDVNYKVDIRKGIVPIEMNQPLYYSEENAHRINVSLFDGIQEVTLNENATCNAYITVKSANQTLGPIAGNISGNTCSVVLPASAYATVSPLKIIINVVDPLPDQGEDAYSVITVLSLNCYVAMTTSGTIIDITGAVVPNLDILVGVIDEIMELGVDRITSLFKGLDSRINYMHNLVNYGYDISCGASTILKSRQGTKVVLDGTTNGNVSTRIILTGEPMYVRSSVFPSAVTSGVKLTNGHRYRLYTVYVSGSTLYEVNPYWTAPGSWNAPAGTRTSGDGYCILDYNTTDYPNGAIAYLSTQKDNTLNDYTVQVFAEDITEGTGVVRYNIAQNLTDAQKEQARENIGAGSMMLLDDLVCASGNLVDYGYRATPVTLDYPTQYMNITRAGVRVTFAGTKEDHKTVTGTYPLVVKMNGTAVRTAASSGIAGLTEPTKLVVGHTYRLWAITTQQDASNTTVILPYVYPRGSYEYTGTRPDGEIGWHRSLAFEYTQAIDNAGGVQICLGYSRNSSTVLVSATVMCILEDLTFGDSGITLTYSGATPSITAAPGVRYVCSAPYLESLSFVPSATGICSVLFKTGSTIPYFTMPNTVKMPDWWTGVEANRTYEICVADGVYGVVTSWT